MGLGLGNQIAISTRVILTQRGNNLAGGRKWAQHLPLININPITLLKDGMKYSE